MLKDRKSGLLAKVGNASFWIAVRLVSVRLLSVAQLLLLTRLLSPTEFGLFAVASMAYAFVEAMTFLGFGQALIQRKTVEPIHLDTLFLVNIARGTLLGLLVLTLSAPISWLMNSPESQKLIAAIGLLPLISGFHNPAMILYQKELQMRQELAFYLVGAVANLSFALVLALQGYGAWSLIAGLIAHAVSQLIVSYRIQSYRPAIQFSKIAFLEMFDFGKWLMASQGLKYFSINLPSWVIGHYLGIQELGLYHVASRISQAIGNEFFSLISIVAFPAFSKMNDDKSRLAEAYIRSQKIISSASFLLFGCLFLLAEPFVKTFYFEKWSGLDGLISLFAIIGLVQSLGSQVEILRAIYKQRFIFIISLVRLAIVSCLIYWLTMEFSVTGAVLAILIPTVILLIPAMSLILRSLNIKNSDYLLVIVPPLLSSIFVSMLISSIVSHLLRFEGNFLYFIFLALLSVIGYVVFLCLIDKAMKTGICTEWKTLFQSLLNNRRQL